MIIEGNGYESNYEEQMLRENEVNNLLSFYTIKINQQIQFWYDISGKRSLRDCVEQEGITEEMLEQFFRYMKTLIEARCGMAPIMGGNLPALICRPQPCQ